MANHDFANAVASAVASVTDAITMQKVAHALRRCGLQHPGGLAALAQLARRAREQQFDFEVDFEDAAEQGGKVAVVFVGCAHFLLELPLLASAAFFGIPTLHHNGESGPIWVHATSSELEAHLCHALKAADIDACWAGLAGLWGAQQILSATPDVSPLRDEASWRGARQALESTCGGCEPCGGGLRARLYCLPNRPADAGLTVSRHVTVHATIAGPQDAAAASATPWTLTIQPALAIDRLEAQKLLSSASPSAGSAEPMYKDASSAAPPVHELSLISLLAPGRAGAPMRTRRVSVPMGERSHAQRWVLDEASRPGALLERVPLRDIRTLPSVLRQLRRHACYAAVCTSVLAETYPVAATAAAPGAKRRRPDQDELESRVELRLTPPASLSLLMAVPACVPSPGLALPGGRPRDALIELQLRIAGSDAADAGPPVWEAQLRSTDDAALALLSAPYAASLLNACHSLPLTLAFLHQRQRGAAGST